MKAKNYLLHQQFSDCLPRNSSIWTHFRMFVQSNCGQHRCVYPIVPAAVPARQGLMLTTCRVTPKGGPSSRAWKPLDWWVSGIVIQWNESLCAGKGRDSRAEVCFLHYLIMHGSPSLSKSASPSSPHFLFSPSFEFIDSLKIRHFSPWLPW